MRLSVSRSNTKYRDLREAFQPEMFMPMIRAALERSNARLMIRSSAGFERDGRGAAEHADGNRS